MTEKKMSVKLDTKPVILRRGEDVDFSFDFNISDGEKRRSFFFSCEDRKFYRYKDESRNDKMYMLIDDSLDVENAEWDRFCLNMSEPSPKLYAKRAAYKIFWTKNNPRLKDFETCRFGVFAKTDGLTVNEGGYLRLRLELWLDKEGVDCGLTKNAPDLTKLVDIKEGSYPYTEFFDTVTVDNSNCMAILLTLEGEKYSGEIYFERPFFEYSSGENILPDFDIGTPGVESFCWCGENLSKREWPSFELKLNGECFFDGEVFLSMHRYSPVEIDIPSGILRNGSNTLTVKYTSDYFMTLPVAINEVFLLEKPSGDFYVSHSPDYLEEGKSLKVLIRTERDGVKLSLESRDFREDSPLEFREAGLHVLSLKPKKYKNRMTYTLKSSERDETYSVSRTVSCESDGVITGSGDMIYIDNSSEKAAMDYFEWYVSNEIGKLLTIRPVYHWGGQRTFNPRVYEKLTALCRELEMNYVLMSDGRDIQGIDMNPSVDELRGEGFLGRQVHERDGQLFYWRQNPRDTKPFAEAFFDLVMRKFRENPEHSEGNYNPENFMTVNGNFTCFKRKMPKIADVRAAHETVLSHLREFSKDFGRHTGPSCMFKYFLEAGFEWVGAETMDGSTEPLLSFMRGACKAYGKKQSGVHHALQWCSTPHDNEKKYRRYMLADYISYMHGATDINTEEGLYFIEHDFAYHNRLSDATENYRKRHRNFAKYIATHTRRGEFYTKTAFLHGRDDGWCGFGSGGLLWGNPEMPAKDGGAESSWQLLKVFYPLNSVTKFGLSRAGYVSPERTEPFGTFSGTPEGPIDVIPVELGELSDYSLLVFAGYNNMEDEDAERLYSYAECGGTLVLTWAHLTNTTLKNKIDLGELEIPMNKLSSALADGEPVFKEIELDGRKIKIVKNLTKSAKIIDSASGEPIACEIEIGKGRVVLVNTLSYPGDEAVFERYSQIVKTLHIYNMRDEDAAALCGTDVGYTVYKRADGTKDFYFTAVDWYNDSEEKRKAKLRVGEYEYVIELEFGELRKVTVKDGIALWLSDMSGEILSFEDGAALVEGEGDLTLFAAKDGKITAKRVEFDENYRAEIKIN